MLNGIALDIGHQISSISVTKCVKYGVEIIYHPT